MGRHGMSQNIVRACTNVVACTQFPETPLFDAPADDGIHLRLFMSPSTLARILLRFILDRGPLYGVRPRVEATDLNGTIEARQRVIVEFSSPNLGRSFDGNHLRSTIIGSSIAALYESMGWDVCRMNFLGDWGKNVGLLAVGWSRFGIDELLHIDPLRHLLDVYTKIDELLQSEKKGAIQGSDLSSEHNEDSVNGELTIAAEQDNHLKRMEDGDVEALALWRRLRDACTAVYPALYAQLGVKFDEYSGESEVTQETTTEVETILREKGVYENLEGAWVIDFQKHGCKGLPTVKARHPNGTTSYLLRDVAAVVQRSNKYKFDKMIYVVSAQQDTHFREVFKTLELMGEEYHDVAKRVQHVSFGKLQGLSPHQGSSGLLLEDVLNQCTQATHEALASDEEDGFLERFRDKRTSGATDAAELARLALASQELSITKRTATLNFTLGTDEKITTSLDSYPGLKIQHWLDKLYMRPGSSGINRILDDDSLDYTIFEQEEAYADMLKLIAQYPNTVAHAFEKLEPSIVLNYLLQVVEALSAVCDEHATSADAEDVMKDAEVDENTAVGQDKPVHDDMYKDEASSQGPDMGQDHLVAALYDCVRIVLENGMNLIGLAPIQHEQDNEKIDTMISAEETSINGNGASENNETPKSPANPQAAGSTAAPSLPESGVDKDAQAAFDSQKLYSEPAPDGNFDEKSKSDDVSALNDEISTGSSTTTADVEDQRTPSTTHPALVILDPILASKEPGVVDSDRV